MTEVKPRNGNAASVADMIAQSTDVKGGHLFISCAGWILHFGTGKTLSGYDDDHMKTRVLVAGGAIIDTRTADQAAFLGLVFHGPMIAVGEDPRFFMCDALSYASLESVAARYRAIGAEIHNIHVGEAGDEPLSLPA